MSKKIFANNDPTKYAIVDDDVYEIIQEIGLKFGIIKDGYFKSTSWVQLPGMAKKKYLLLHRFVWILKTGEEASSEVDHENRDKSNNQFENLRLATRKQQQHNQGKRITNTSGFIGISCKHTNKHYKNGGNYYWVAQIRKPGGYHEAKCFPFTENGKQHAAMWYDDRARKYYGEFHGQLNFPMPTD